MQRKSPSRAFDQGGTKEVMPRVRERTPLIFPTPRLPLRLSANQRELTETRQAQNRICKIK